MQAGNIEISDKLLLRWLQFEDGEILEAKHDIERQCIEIILRHQEMPEVKDGFIKPILPSYTTYQDGFGNKVAIREPLNKE